VPKAIYALELSFAANSAEPWQNDLLAMHSEQTLLIDESSSVTRLLDAHLYLDDTLSSGPASITRPVISRRAVSHYALSGWRDRSGDVAEIRRAVQIILAQIAADADTKLLLMTAERAPAYGRGLP